MRMHRNFALTLSLIISIAPLSSCLKKNNKSNATTSSTTEALSDAPIKSDENGVIVGTIDPNMSQRLAVSADSGIAGTEVVFAAGTFSIPVDVTLQEGQDMDVTAMKGELELGDDITITPVTGTLHIMPSEPVDPLKPITVKMPYNAGLHLQDDDTIPAVLFHGIRYDQDQQVVVGINPTADITIANGFVTFPINYFGTASVVRVPRSINSSREVNSSRTIPAGKSEEAPATTTTEDTLELASHTPTAGTTTSRPSAIVLTFNSDIDSKTASSAIIVKRGSESVPGSVSVSGKEATFTPSQSFALEATYDVAVASTLKSSSGVALATAAAFQFTVNGGAWQATPGTVNSFGELEGKAALASLNHGRYGFASNSFDPGTVQIAWTGTAWTSANIKAETGSLAEFSSTSSWDGRFYVAYTSDGQPIANRYNPSFAQAYDLTTDSNGNPVIGTYNSLRVLGLGEQKVLYLYKNSSTHAFSSRVLTGDSWGSTASIIATAVNGRFEPVVASNPQGYAALAYYVSGTNELHAHRFDTNGTWTHLTPVGNELTASYSANLGIGVDKSGKVSIFWCESGTSCFIKAHNGSNWGTAVPLTMAGTNSSFSFVGDAEGRYILSWINTDSGQKYQAVSFINGVWSTVMNIDTGATGLTSPRGMGVDALGRFVTAYSNAGTVKASRFVNNAWTTPVGIYTGFTQAIKLAVDPSGEAMVSWFDGGSPVQVFNYMIYK